MSNVRILLPHCTELWPEAQSEKDEERKHTKLMPRADTHSLSVPQSCFSPSVLQTGDHRSIVGRCWKSVKN